MFPLSLKEDYMQKVKYVRVVWFPLPLILFLLLLIILAVPNKVAFACTCGAGGTITTPGSQGTITVVNGGNGAGNGGGTSSSSGGSKGGGNGLSGRSAGSGAGASGGGGGTSAGYYGEIGNTGICFHATDSGGVDHTGSCGSSKNSHNSKPHKTTTVQVFYLCDNVIVTSADVTCDHTTYWSLNATATWPDIPIDVRPYPATVNRWPTVLRVDSLPTSTGSAFLAYASMGGGSPTNPAGGDWRNITLTVTIYPDPGVLPQVYLQNIGWITPPIGQLYTFQWSLPSHPAAGGGPTAGAVGQLEELPQDMPLYTNQARAAYLVSCELDYQEYENVCVLGADASGNTNCDNNRGHNVNEWVNHSMTQNLPVTKSTVPASMMADTNGDGIPDAYWDPGVVINRMNDADSVSDPVYGHSYSWGDIFYWGVREAQGQITFP